MNYGLTEVYLAFFSQAKIRNRTIEGFAALVGS